MVRRVPENGDLDIVAARAEARELVEERGLDNVDQARIATVVSEMVRNIVVLKWL
jgi:anti-sigma regulatory factor (Ser/Thr protein kinase)